MKFTVVSQTLSDPLCDIIKYKVKIVSCLFNVVWTAGVSLLQSTANDATTVPYEWN